MSLHGSSGALLQAMVAGLSSLGLGLAVYTLAQEGRPLARAIARYVASLDRAYAVLHRPARGASICRTQAALIGIIAALYASVGIPYAAVWITCICVLPLAILRRERRRRVARLEAQVDSFMVALANSLKSIPNAGAALASTLIVLQDPMRQEIEHVLKEVRLGSTLEDALLAMSLRVQSRAVDTAFSAIVMGLRVGGQLPLVLERTAASLREMNRLWGFVRSKTSEGRAQLWLLAAFPLFVVFGFSLMQRGYFDPLQHSALGQLASAASVLFWLASLVAARKVLAVDI